MPTENDEAGFVQAITYTNPEDELHVQLDRVLPEYLVEMVDLRELRIIEALLAEAQHTVTRAKEELERRRAMTEYQAHVAKRKDTA